MRFYLCPIMRVMRHRNAVCSVHSPTVALCICQHIIGALACHRANTFLAIVRAAFSHSVRP